VYIVRIFGWTSTFEGIMIFLSPAFSSCGSLLVHFSESELVERMNWEGGLALGKMFGERRKVPSALGGGGG
jgi:hypothetical protein